MKCVSALEPFNRSIGLMMILAVVPLRIIPRRFISEFQREDLNCLPSLVRGYYCWNSKAGDPGRQ